MSTVTLPKGATNTAGAFCRTVLMATLLGPLIGGGIYNWMIIFVPYSYIVGVVPAFIASTALAAWVATQPERPPNWALRVMGVLCAVAATLVWSEIVEVTKPGFLMGMPRSFGYLVPHSIFAALILSPLVVGGRSPRPKTATDVTMPL